MQRTCARSAVALPAAATLLFTGLTAKPLAVNAHAAAPGVRVLTTQQVLTQSVLTPAGSGNQSNATLQSAVAADPVHPQRAVTATSVGTVGGEPVALEYATTGNGGASWRHNVVRGITQAAGGPWARTAWPTLTATRSGTFFLAARVLAARERRQCDNALVILRSTDHGVRFRAPQYLQFTKNCDVLADKVSVAADTNPHSPYFGRIYLGWTELYFTGGSITGTVTGTAQKIMYSADDGRHWSRPLTLATSKGYWTEGSALAVLPSGAVTQVYYTLVISTGAATLRAATSTDGGRHLASSVPVVAPWVFGPTPARCCMPAVAADPVTGWLYLTVSDAAAHSGKRGDAVVYRSRNGARWNGPVVAGSKPGWDINTPSIAAYAGRVFVSWGAVPLTGSLIWRQYASLSTDAGGKYQTPVTLGPDGDLNAAPRSADGFLWPSDYMSSVGTRAGAYITWTLPLIGIVRPHQAVWAATLASSS